MAARRTVAVNPTFKLGFIANSIACFVSLCVVLVVSYWPPADPDRGKELFFIFKHILLLGTGAFLGLLGGKVSAPDP